MKVLILSALVPDKHNRGGPSGLIWECISVLESSGVCFDLKVEKSGGVFSKMGIFFKKIDVCANYDVIFVYPFNLFFKLNSADRSKSIVLGPDSPSLLFARFYRSSFSLFKRIKYGMLSYWFGLKERQLLNQSKKFLMVGKNDLRWVKKNNNFSLNAFYLTHPILTSIVESLNFESAITEYNKLSLVFAGDLSPKYTGDYIDIISNVLVNYDYGVIVVGSNNKWVYDLFFDRGLKNAVYVDWIENYLDICNPSYHIHVFPLAAGAGTKNRTLTACAVGVPVITSSIGYENIMYGQPINDVRVFSNINDFEKILASFLLTSSIDSTKKSTYIDRVNSRFKSELISFFGGGL